jgi:hypothetical protein
MLTEILVASDTLRTKLDGMARDLVIYGQLLANQRKGDLLGLNQGFYRIIGNKIFVSFNQQSSIVNAS